MEVVDKHLKIKTAEELADYIEKDVDIYAVDGNNVLGYCNDIAFQIIFDYGASMMVFVPSGHSETLHELVHLVAPVMWTKREECINDGWYSPMVEYEGDDLLVCEWNYIDPVARLTDIMLSAKRLDPNAVKVRIMYPGYSKEYFDEALKYGNYTGFFSQSIASKLDSLNEIEVFYLMEGYFGEYDHTAKRTDLVPSEQEKELDAINYCIAKLAQETKRFGVPMHEPTEEFMLECPEIYAWLMWWRRGITKILKKNPKIENAMFKGKKIGITPDGNFKDFVPEALSALRRADELYDRIANSVADDLEASRTVPYLRIVTDDEDDDEK